jgi:hydroxymethylpyrimidine pyrophosphatase-like HAD family hydrolase
MKERPLNKIYVDLDGTLSKTHFNEETGHYDLGEVYEPVAEAITNQHFKGREIYIFTARPKKEREEIKQWLQENAIPYKKITNKKKPAIMYVDDKAVRPDEFYIFDKTEK